MDFCVGYGFLIFRNVKFSLLNLKNVQIFKCLMCLFMIVLFNHFIELIFLTIIALASYVNAINDLPDFLLKSFVLSLKLLKVMHELVASFIQVCFACERYFCLLFNKLPKLSRFKFNLKDTWFSHFYFIFNYQLK